MTAMRPYGTWPSPITAAMVAAQGLRLGGVAVDGDDVYWSEGRPSEGGRLVLVRWREGRTADVTPPDFNTRTRMHEYGGGAHLVHRGTAYCVNFADQRIYRLAAGAPDSPHPVTPTGRWHYADMQMDAPRDRLICVREDHTDPAREALTTIVAVPLAAPPGDVRTLVSGSDFYSSPRVSPDGTLLAWLSWNHPRMPWDGTELWVARIAGDGAVEGARRVAGGERESIYQPGWLPDGSLCLVSDRSGWWRLYRVDGADVHDLLQRPAARGARLEPCIADPPDRAEFGRPQWAFGTQTWAAAGEERLAVSCTSGGRWRLGLLDRAGRALVPLVPDLEPHEWLAATPTHVTLVASSPRQPARIVRVDLAGGGVETLRTSFETALDPGYLSQPRAIEFPTSGGRTAHAFFYPPANKDVQPPAAERPPVIAISHGGPTTAATDTLDLRIQFWTSRGFAVVDVNYGGSSGYGREYRERLNGQWGIVDVDDVVQAVLYLTSRAEGDRARLIARGGSAGGYTTLAALTFRSGVFRAGASYYGVSDLEILARDTHKFEARYLDGLVGPYPAMREEYRRRSPIHAVDALSCPLIFFQGLDDLVVPPNQSERMADAVRRKGLPVAHLTFAGEQHGFRKAETIIRCLEAELYFYGKVFGFKPADEIESVGIDNGS